KNIRKIDSDKTNDCLEDNVKDNIQFTHEEQSVSHLEIGKKFLSPKKSKNSGEKLSSPEKIEGGIQFELEENLSSQNRISSPEVIKCSKMSKSSISPTIKNQSKQEYKSESSDSDSDAESRKAIKESAQKRIIQNISTSESDSKKFMRPITKFYEEHSDSESVP
ncbi:hypothetical protein L9F63_008323, partial [Diploptera punctata]